MRVRVGVVNNLQKAHAPKKQVNYRCNSLFEINLVLTGYPDVPQLILRFVRSYCTVVLATFAYRNHLASEKPRNFGGEYGISPDRSFVPGSNNVRSYSTSKARRYH